ncbi:MAG: methyltransferase domain-containing protein [Oscillospiraceae bacterium]|nr:methyltransferase domain-containing protein [Oscillospiraceae bacterium]
MSRMSPDITGALLSLLHPGETVLDVGSGDASLLQALSGRGLTLCGIDPSYRDGQCPALPPDVSLQAGSGEALPFRDSVFDAVVLQCVFSLCKPEETVREILRVLKPGGRLILSDLFTDSPAAETVFTGSPLLSRLYLRQHLERFFSSGFRPVSFQDMTDALRELIIEVIWDGEDCASCGDLAALRGAKARYGLWVWQKSDSL